jgi:hypothetical protein
MRCLARWAFCGITLVLAGCADMQSALDEGRGAENTAEWRVIPAQRAWIHVPHSLMPMEREHGREREQRLALRNETNLPGDNQIYLRTVAGTPPGVMRMDRIIEQAGGVPAPFTTSDLATMRSVEDDAGALIWAEWTSGAGTSCVFALRRLTPRHRVIPHGAGAMDVVMRNCVRGNARQALAPLDAATATLGASARPGPGGGLRPLSPLAAPLP